MIPSALCDLINQILGPLVDIPLIGDLFAQILSFIEQFCADNTTS
jgi:hypothetical protein